VREHASVTFFLQIGYAIVDHFSVFSLQDSLKHSIYNDENQRDLTTYLWCADVYLSAFTFSVASAGSFLLWQYLLLDQPLVNTVGF
jgi:hypothetical protein